MAIIIIHNNQIMRRRRGKKGWQYGIIILVSEFYEFRIINYFCPGSREKGGKLVLDPENLFWIQNTCSGSRTRTKMDMSHVRVNASTHLPSQ